MTSLRFPGAGRLTSAFFLHLPARCPALQRLDVSNCHQFGESALMALVKSCPHLTHLGLEGCRRLGPASIDVVVAHTPMLQVRVATPVRFSVC